MGGGGFDDGDDGDAPMMGGAPGGAPGGMPGMPGGGAGGNPLADLASNPHFATIM